jgi:phosphoglycerate dehydrogenase-like enzyme
MSANPTLVIYTHPDSSQPFASIPAQFPNVNIYIEETSEGFEQTAAEVDIICMARKYQRSTVLQARNLKWLHVGGTGIDRLLPLEELNPELIITNTPALNAEMMADYVACVLLMLTWDFPRLFRNQLQRSWERWGAERVDGKTAALVGLGGIGQPIIKRLQTLGMRIVGVRRTAEPVPGVERVFAPDQLHVVLAEADYLILAVPLTPETEGMIGPDELQIMKRGAFLINVSRGKIVQEQALITSLKAGQIAGAALDVFEQEPLPPESQLWGLENLILTPHISSWSSDYLELAARVFVENLERYLADQPLLYVVDRQRGY